MERSTSVTALLLTAEENVIVSVPPVLVYVPTFTADSSSEPVLNTRLP